MKVPMPYFLSSQSMEEDIQPLEGVSFDLRNDDTDKKLQFIEELNKLGASKYVDLPQVCYFRSKPSHYSLTGSF